MNEQFSTMEDDEMWLDGEGYDFSEDDDDEDDDDEVFAEDLAEDDDDEDDDDEAFADAFSEDDDDESLGGEESEERRWRRKRYSAARRAAARRLRRLRSLAKARAKLQRKRAAGLKRISGATRIRLRRSSGTAGSKAIVVRTPTGRVMRMGLPDGIVTSSHYNKFVQDTNKNLGQLRQSIALNGKAVTSLRKAQEKTTKTLSSQQASMTTSIAKEMGKAQKAAQRELRKEAAKVRKMVKDANRRQMLNQLTLATAIPVFRAYGESGDPFSQRNLTLLGGTLAAMYSDELLQKFTRGSTSDQLATGWSYGAPMLLAGAAHLAFKDDPTENQYVLHAAEVTAPAAGATTSIEIGSIAARKDSKVVGFLNVPDTLTIEPEGSVSKESKLKLRVEGGTGSTSGEKFTVAVIIDNKA